MGTMKKQPTKDELKSQWEAFHAWCAENNLKALPAKPETVLKYLRHFSPEKYADLAPVILTAVRKHHEESKLVSPTYAPQVKAHLREMRKKIAADDAAKEAIEAEKVAEIPPGEKRVKFLAKTPERCPFKVPIAVYIDPTHAEIGAGACPTCHRDIGQQAEAFEILEVNIPDWMDPEEYTTGFAAWELLWAAGIPRDWPEAWQRGLLTLSTAQRIGLAKLLQTKEFRAEDRKRAKARAIAWFQADSATRTRSPFNAREWSYLVVDRFYRDAARVDRSMTFDVPHKA